MNRLYWPTSIFTPLSGYSSYQSPRMSYASPVQLGDTGESPKPPIINAVDAPPPNYDSLGQVTYHGLGVQKLLVASRPETERSLEGITMHPISSLRSSLSMTGGVSGESPNGEEEEKRDCKKQEEKCKGEEGGELKKCMKDKMEHAANASGVKTVEGNSDGMPSTSVSYIVTPHPSFTGPLHTISFSVSDPRQDMSPV